MTSSRSVSRFTIAETGHLVFASLHKRHSAFASPDHRRVPAEQQTQSGFSLQRALTGIVYQRLIPRSWADSSLL